MTIWEDIQSIEKLNTEVNQKIQRLESDNEIYKAYLPRLKEICGEGPTFNAGTFWVQTVIESNNETKGRLERFRDFLNMTSDVIRGV